MEFTDEYFLQLTNGQTNNDGPRPRRLITHACMKSVVRFVKGRVTGDVPEMLPEIQQLVSMVDSEASLPVYTFLNDYLDKVDSSLDLQVCMLLYPDAKRKEELEYLPECKAVGISEVELIVSGGVRGIPTSLMTRGLMVEIYRYGGKYFGGNCINNFYETIRAIFQINQMITTEQCSLFSKVRRDAEKMVKLKRFKQFEQLKQVKAEIFGIADLPGKKADDEVDPLIERLRSFDIKVGVVGIPVEVRGVVESLTNSLGLLQLEVTSGKMILETDLERNRQERAEMIEQHRQEIVGMQIRLDEKTGQLKAARSLRDHYKKETVKVRREKSELVSQQQMDVDNFEQQIQKMSTTIADLEREKRNLKEQVRYKGVGKTNVSSDLFSRKIGELQDEVEFWQGQYVDCKEQMEGFLKQTDVVTFEDGRYTDTVREVYMELMCMRVGAKNVQKIIKTVMGKMAGVLPQRLPGSTFAKYMLLEARSVALSHLKEEIHSAEGNLTVGPDGTTKFGKHYGAISISLSGKTMCMGMRDMACGDAEAYQKLLEGIVREITGDENAEMRSIAAKIKNTISDQASVNKKFVTLLSEWREKALPHIIGNWESLADNQKERYASINFFFCGLHFLVGLSEQANKTLSLWESLVHSGQKVGAPSLPGGYSKSGEAGTTRMVRTVCKAVQDRGCEKSGKPVEFREFLHAQGQVKDVPLASFKGNRFNILFHNSAGVYYLLHDLLSFAEEHKTDNKLFGAIDSDLNILAFQAGARALGIISKMVTGPMWRFLEKEGHVSELSPVYQHLYSAFKRLSTDASDLLKGEEFLFGEEAVKKDTVYECLVNPSVELDDLTCQILELLFSSFQIVCSRQLKDHLEGGKYFTNWSSDLLAESATVPKTNIGPERIFGQLDNLIRVMPRATTNAIEGITMWTQNHTATWLNNLDSAHCEKVLKDARENSREQRQMYIERVASIRQQRQADLVSKREKKEAKEQRERTKKEELTEKLQEIGGLWKTPDEVDRKVRALSDDKKVKTLQVQIMFRRHVLGTPNTGKIMNIMSQGRYLSAEKLSTNLKCVIRNGEEARPIASNEVSTTSNPISSVCLQEEKAKFQKLAEAERQKRSKSTKRQKTAGGSASTVVPETPDPEDLIGKRVQHLLDEPDGSTKWYYGIVTGLKVRRGKYMYSLVYDGESETYNFPLLDDMENGELRIVPLDSEFIVGRRVDHRFRREDDGEVIWYTGKVSSYDVATDLCTIIYDYEIDDDDDCIDEDEDEEPNNVFEEPLLEDYNNGDVRLLL